MNNRTKRIFENLIQVPPNIEEDPDRSLVPIIRPRSADFGSDDSVYDKDYIPDSYENSSDNDISPPCKIYKRVEIQRVTKRLFSEKTAKVDETELIQLSDLLPSKQIEQERHREPELPLENLDIITQSQLSKPGTPIPSSAPTSPCLEALNLLDIVEPQRQSLTPLHHVSTNPAVIDSPLEFIDIQNRPVTESEIKKRPSKKKANPTQWKRAIAKKKRLTGSAYKSAVAKKNSDIPERELKPPCQCKMKCYEKINADERDKICNQFWKKCSSWDQRRQFVASHVTKDTKARQKTNSKLEDDRRKYTFTYFLEVDYKKIKVCQVMFLNTLSVGKKFVKISIEKVLESGMVHPDQRGHHTPGNKLPDAVKESVKKHISSYPVYESHYSRQKTQKKFLGPELNINLMYKQYVEIMEKANATQNEVAKEWLYRFIFNTEFCLSFKLPGIDTCDDCDRFIRKLKDCNNEEEKIKIEEDREKHLREAQSRYEMKNNDKKDALNSNKKRVICVDLQKCLPTPNLTNNQSFYLRKLWTLNLTVYDTTKKITSNYVWPENYGGRGGNEIGSCLIKWAEENIDETVEEITIYSDNCTGQNRNSAIVMAYQWLLQKYPTLKIINHKFMLKGHTHMEVDHAHSIIERKKKKLSTMELVTPRDWAQFIRTCEGKNPFRVTEMTVHDFKDITALCKKTSAPLIVRKKNSDKNDFKISETIWWHFRQDKKGTLFYKTKLDASAEVFIPFLELSLIRHPKQNLTMPSRLKNVRSTEKPISTAKYNDILTLLQWVPESCHDFYKQLSHSTSASDVPESDGVDIE